MLLADSCELAGVAAAPAEHVIGPSRRGRARAAGSDFPALARLRGDARARWLLGRPGLVDVLLRTGEDLEPADFLCEADVFSAVWRSLIRGDEIHAAGAASPDDREHAALSVAKRSLGLPSEPVPGTASAELRSDGVLRVPNDPALSPGDEFSTDLFRDFALCRLFRSRAGGRWLRPGAPRWSIRATRLGCQAALLARRRPRPGQFCRLSSPQIAQSHGERWLEVPFEALLTLGDAEQAIRELWDALTAGGGSSLATLLRLAEARYVNGTIGDAFALAPLVKVAFCDRPTTIHGPRFGHRTVHEVDPTTSSSRGCEEWLPPDRNPDQLRQAVRDTILADDPPHYDDFSIEALATLGPDLDDRAEAWLRRFAKERPGNLNPAVESFVVALSMSQARPQLLLDLAEAYYIELPDPRDRWGGGHILDDGIRDFRHGLGPGFGVPAAAWYYGPFFRLLNTRPIETIGFINRMLDHAAKFRVEKMSTLPQRRRSLRKNSKAFAWICPALRRAVVCRRRPCLGLVPRNERRPYACMSALLALERFIDDLLERLNVPARRIVELLLADCHNLAVPGLGRVPDTPPEGH